MSTPCPPPEPQKSSKRGGNPLYLIAVLLAAFFSYYFNSHQQIGIYEDFNLPQKDVRYDQNHTKDLNNDKNQFKNDRNISVEAPTRKIDHTAHTEIHKNKPKLAIVVDDICKEEEVRDLKKLKLVLNYSFFPSKPHFPTTKLSQNVSFAMIHLPLEAFNYKDDNPTLSVATSIDEMNKTIQKLRVDFPHIHTINNHTGSKFTENCVAMQRLLPLLATADFNFLDSMTSSRSCGRQVANTLALPIWERDVFLDHDADVAIIKKQIQVAVAMAKTKGHCIAICHPRPTTLQALRESLKELKEVELVDLNRIPRN